MLDGTAPDDADPSDRGRTIRAVGLGSVVMVVAVLAAVLIFTSPQVQMGSQWSSNPEIALRQASVDGWKPLVPTAGRLRDGFPEPMVWRSDRVCLGFARADFEVQRPSLARCERHLPDRPLAIDEIRSLHSIESGFDTWHFIEAADRVEAVSVILSTGESLSGDRIHLSDSTIALRLENGHDLSSIRWSTRSQTFQCASEPSAWRTSQFCAK